MIQYAISKTNIEDLIEQEHPGWPGQREDRGV